ncbi:AAA family ATPase [Methanobrevibacter boviskoreani]|uniref:AAA family ATPase n=1 Tax=Methanobrevibacter boviskoreani TaxID=1348249 RepID=UPI0023F1662B|nr:SMC family ATPase [Methanobrevibacter boviskoreani]MDD6257382.1 SMC family ATPase [Methanobrevibacter boviskoreani]
MIFDRLQLKNFKSHLNTDIKFNSGITLIVGENGAGKSSIFEAISFALFKQHSARTINDLMRSSKDNSAYNAMSVSLEFTSNGNHYKVVRTRDKTSSKAMLYIKKPNMNDDSDFSYGVICENDKNVTAEIQKILQMDSDLFLNAIYVRQGEIAELVSKTSAEKKKLIAKLLGIDSLEKSYNNLRPFINDFEHNESELKGKLSKKTDVEEELKNKKAEYEDLKKDGINVEQECIQTEKNFDELNSKKVFLEANKEEFNNIKIKLDNGLNEIYRLKSEKNDLQNKLDEITKAESEIQKLEKYVNKLPVYLEFQEASKRLIDLKHTRDGLEEDKNIVSKQKEILEENKTSYEDYSRLEKIIEDLRNDKSKVDGDVKVLDKYLEDKSILEKEFNKDNNDLEDFKIAISEKLAKDGIDDVKDKELGEIHKVISDEIQSSEYRITKIDDEKSNKKSEIAICEDNIKTSEKPLEELDSVGNKCPICQSDISNQKKLDLKKSYKKSIINSRKRITQNNKDLVILDKEKSGIKARINRLNSIKDDISENIYLVNKIENNKNKLDNLDKEIMAKESSRDMVDKLAKAIESESEKRDFSKEGYFKYMKAKGLLDERPSINEIDHKIANINDDWDFQVRKIKLAINKDSHLTTEITEEELSYRIDNLKEKETRYNQLKGYVKVKGSIESQLLTKKESLSSTQNLVDNYRKNIQLIKYDEEAYNTLVSNLATVETKLKRLQSEVSKIEGQAIALGGQIDSLIKEQKEYTRLQKEYEDIRTFVSFLDEIRFLFSKDGMQEDLRKLSRPTIQKYTKEFFEEFNFDYSDLILDDEFNVSLYGPEGESTLDMVSGGEKIAIALALRLGITKAMSSGAMETILLDEPTIHLDSFRRHELIDLLRKMSSLPQMIIVTHDEELENAADSLIKIGKKDGISQVIGVE